ncbi:FecR family protein [Algoriphagus sp. Y33]|uniref:FecR family protein n=1 Tax=Algoriphagus sp. Y33 TaxID=2772483 RepID=UPI00177AF2E6|nr:FecR family protein [Algoriphagus sp. Y33]
MNGFHPRSIEDFLKCADFIDWINNPKPNTDKFWEDWCARNPDKINMLQHARELLQGMKLEENNKLDKKERNQILEKLIIENRAYNRRRITEYREKMSRSTSIRIRAVAASVVLIGVLFFGRSLLTEKENTPVHNEISWVTKVVPRGIKKVFTLPDNSVVTVNSGSEFSYSSDFSNDRMVKLKGQAFFEVTSDPKRPFRVVSKDITTMVLGTSFDMKAYDDGSDLHVAVVSGKVEVKTEVGLNSLLTKGEVSFYNPELQAMQKTDYDYEELIGWKDKIIKFDRASYNEVFRVLSNWYDIDFIVDPSLRLRGKYTAKFKDQSLPNVIIGLEHSSNLKFEFQGKQVLVSRKQQNDIK